MKRIVLITVLLCTICATAFVLGGCKGNSSGFSEGEADINTIQPCDLSEEEAAIVDLISSGSFDSISEFAVDESYSRVRVGYDYFEKGKLIGESCNEVEMPFSYEDGPQTSFGKIYTDIDDDDAEISISISGSKGDETSQTGGKSPLSNYDHTLEDLSGQARIALEEPVTITNNKKIYIWATVGDNKDETRVSDILTVMADKELLAEYDKAFVFYARFE